MELLVYAMVSLRNVFRWRIEVAYTNAFGKGLSKKGGAGGVR